MSDQPSPPSPQRRRSSIVDLFSSRPALSVAAPNNAPANQTSSPSSTGVPPSPNTAQHRRGASITALGLAGSSPGSSSPFGAFARQRRASIATSSGSGSPEFRNSFGDEPAVLEDEEIVRPPINSPLGRRLSFGAQALRDVKQGGSPGNSGAGRRPSSSLFTLSESNENRAPLSQSQGQGTSSADMAKTAGKSRGLASFEICALVALETFYTLAAWY
jgi:hypothetical protein